MRAVVQRVSRASVKIDSETVGAIECGLLVLLGVAHDDAESDAEYLAEKISGLRIFEAAEAAAVALYQSDAQIRLAGEMIMNGRITDAQNAADMLITERIEATRQQQLFCDVQNAFLSVFCGIGYRFHEMTLLTGQ